MVNQPIGNHGLASFGVVEFEFLLNMHAILILTLKISFL